MAKRMMVVVKIGQSGGGAERCGRSRAHAEDHRARHLCQLREALLQRSHLRTLLHQLSFLPSSSIDRSDIKTLGDFSLH